MDPDEALRELRELLGPDRELYPSPQGMDRIAELFAALDEWCSNGGFLPVAWMKGRS